MELPRVRALRFLDKNNNMKKTKIIVFVTALSFLLFANVSVTLFDGTDSEIRIELSSDLEAQEVIAVPPGGSAGGGTSHYQGYVNRTFHRGCRKRGGICEL